MIFGHDGADRVRGLHRRWARWARARGSEIAVGAGLALVVLGTAGFLGVLDAVRENDDLATLDQPVLDALVAGRGPGLTAVMAAISTATGPQVLPVLALVGCLTWGYLGRGWWQPALLMSAMAAAALVSLTLKAVIARPRPPLGAMDVAGSESTYSFPSGHTIGTATLLLVVGYLLWVRAPTVRSLVVWVAAAGTGTFVVALSRLYLGYHFVTDVVASVLLATAVLGGVVVIDRRRAAGAARAAGPEGRPRQDSNLQPTD